MSDDVKCERCEQLKACSDHPEALVGSRWQSGVLPVVRVVAGFPGRTDCWCVVFEPDGGSVGVLSLVTFDRWVRLPEAPAPMPTPPVIADPFELFELSCPSTDVCGFCGDQECDGISCIANLDPEDHDDFEAINMLHRWLRRGRLLEQLEAALAVQENR